jgi:iron(III) transport system substrate-binding protein
MDRRSLGALVTACALVVALAAGCSSDDDRLVVYSGRSKELIGPLLDRFAEETGTKIDVRYGDSADLALALSEEGERSEADVFISQSPGAMGFVESEGLLAELPEDVLSQVPEDDVSDEGRWVGLTGRVRVLVYNKDLVAEEDLPASVLDLVEPEYEGQVGVAPTNASFQDFVTYLRSDIGDDAAAAWLEGMAGNDAQTFANNVDIVAAVADGDLPMGLVNHYYVAQEKAVDPLTDAELHFFPGGDPGALLLVTTAGLLGTADQEESGRELVEFLLTEESQEYFATETDEYPLVEGIDVADTVVPFDQIEVTRTDLSALGSGLKDTVTMIEDSGLRTS